MREPIPFPKQPTPPLSPSAPPTPARAHLKGWRLGLVILGFSAVLLRLLLFLITHALHHQAAALPTWPLHAGDVLTLTPGDANIAKWGQNPLSDGFVVQQLESAGKPLAPGHVCALEPDYMADAQQPGGTLTLLSQQPTGDWRVRWSGGNTLPPFIKQKGDFDANCGTQATLLMSPAQLHTFLDILNGVADSAPPTAAAQPSK